MSPRARLLVGCSAAHTGLATVFGLTGHSALAVATAAIAAAIALVVLAHLVRLGSRP